MNTRDEIKKQLAQVSKELDATRVGIDTKWRMIRDIVIENPSTLEALDELEGLVSGIRHLKARARQLTEKQRFLRVSSESV